MTLLTRCDAFELFEGRFWVLVAFFTGRCVVILVKAKGVDKLSSMSESIIRARPDAGVVLEKKKRAHG